MQKGMKQQVLSKWRTVAKKWGIGNTEIE